MNWKSFPPQLLSAIEITSTILMTGAIALEFGNLYYQLTVRQPLDSLYPILAIARFAMACHLVEAVISTFYASKRHQMPIKYAIYTFFVGTVGLLKISGQLDLSENN
jgi:RsiW-degrading membrane proteinase PrsW (M82 family)